MKQTVDMEAYCAVCQKVTMHTATFAGRFLKDRICKECGSEERGDRTTLLKAYADELVDRTLSKPLKLRQEWKKSHRELLLSLPGRIVKRPLQEVKYLAELLSKDKVKPTDEVEDDSSGSAAQQDHDTCRGKP